MGDGLGNVIQSRGFQFTEVPIAHSNVFDGELIWTPRLPKSPTLVKDKWIYAFQFPSNGQKAMLAAEYHADKVGALTFVAGVKRRAVEPPAAPKKGTPVPEAGLPLVVQGDAVKYAFVVMQGRLGKAAIWKIEDGLHHIFERVNLADDSAFLKGSKNQSFVPVVDVLTVLAGLHQVYETALNEAINYTVVHPKNPHNSEVEVRTRKYQLAKLIEGSLLSSESGASDRLKLADHLAGGGSKLRNFIEDYESSLRKLSWNSRNAARELIRFLNSLVMVAMDWYAGTSQARSSIGHFWLDAVGRALDRLSETPEGRDLERQLVKDEEKGLLSFFFAPDEDADDEAFALNGEWFPIARKAVTGVAVALAEMAPALMVYGKVRAASLRKITATIGAILVQTEVKIITGPAAGQVSALIGVRRTSMRIQINVDQAKPDVSKWIEEGKPHWPEETKWAKPSEILGKVLMCVELVNLYNNMRKFFSEPDGDSASEAVGAIIDLVVALEDPLRAVAKSRDATLAARESRAPAQAAAREVSEASEASEAAAEASGAAAEEAEAVGFWGKLATPAVFKALGAVSAAIDVWINTKEGLAAHRHGDDGVATGYFTVAGGSALIVVASITNGLGYYAGAAALTAASASFLIVGVVILVIGFSLIAYFSTSSWQKFARHCCFGTTPAKAGEEAWSGGDFSEWTETKEGLDRQIDVLTALMCAFTASGAFKTSGHGSDAETITVTFGALPPKSRLELEFNIEFGEGVVHRPKYVLDLETLHCEFHGDAKALADIQPYRQEGRIHSVMLTADRPAALERGKIAASECEILVRYARKAADETVTGTIPVKKPLTYKIYSDLGMNYQDQSSLSSGEAE